jgi:ABC-type branched-subunit amino acid transport system ATPase component
MGNDILAVKHLSKSFGAHIVLRDIHFTVNKGDVIKARGFMKDGTPVGTTMSRTFGK